jgi:hypothetical protein
MSSLRLLPEKSNAKHLFVEITTDALEKAGIPKGTNIYIRNARKFKIDELTAWKTPDGLRITYAFEDGENIILYSPKDENLMDIFHKSEVHFLGRVMYVQIETKETKPGKYSVPTDAKTVGVQMANNKYQHLGLKAGYLAIIKVGETRNGDFVGALDKETGNYHFGFAISFAQTISLTIGGGDDVPHLFDKDEIEIAGKVIGYCEPQSSRMFPLNTRGSE